MQVGIIDYGLGNLRSVAGAVARTGHSPLISSDKRELERCDLLILPGVGAFADGMKNLQELNLVKALNEIVIEKKKPILGICLGFQLMAGESFEFGHHAGLGWIEASVKRIDDGNRSIRIPHVGWNDLEIISHDRLFRDIDFGILCYFVHSFHVICDEMQYVSAKCFHGREIVAAYEKGNIVGTQFHPEKSQKSGIQIIENFICRYSQVSAQ